MKTVLVVEDNKDNLKIATYALERAGYRVVSAVRGDEALEIVLRNDLAFILMDINLPGEDGITVTRRIRESKVDDSVPIIAVTSYAMPGDRERFLAAGCNGYIEKPIDPLSIVNEIHKIIGISES